MSKDDRTYFIGFVCGTLGTSVVGWFVRWGLHDQHHISPDLIPSIYGWIMGVAIIIFLLRIKTDTK